MASSTTAAVADDINRARSIEEMDEFMRKTRAAERELKELVERELATAKVAEVQVSEQWRKILRLAKVRTPSLFGSSGGAPDALSPPLPHAHLPSTPPPPSPPPRPPTDVQMEDLKRDLELVSTGHDRAMELRDMAIAAELRALNDADLQHAASVRAHMRGLIALQAAFDARVGTLDAEFEREVHALEREFAAERASLIARHAAFRFELQHALAAVEQEAAATTASEEAEFDQAREALRRRATERLTELQATMDTRIETAEAAFEQAHLEYLNATSARTAEVKVLTERSAADALTSNRQQRALARLQKLLTFWRSKAINNKRDAAGRNEDLEGEGAAMARHVESIKTGITKRRAAHLDRLKAISSAAAAVKGRLAAASSTAEKLLVEAEAARKLESLGEKLDPFAAARPGVVPAGTAFAGSAAAYAVLDARAEEAARDDALAADVVDASPSSNVTAVVSNAVIGLRAIDAAPGAPAAAAEATALQPFYARLNKALLESLALERRRARLRAENQELQDALQQVLDGLRVTPSALDAPNALVVVNGRAALDMGAGTAAAPSRAALIQAATATGPPGRETRVRIGGNVGAALRVRPGASGVATVTIEGAMVARMPGKMR